MNRIIQRYQKQTVANEDAPVLHFLDSLNALKQYSYLEVGAGLGRFPLSLMDRKNLVITCLEINKELSEKLEAKNLSVVEGSVTHLPFDDNSFDIIHCSHLIEHFGYPEITKVIDELLRVVKHDGHLIIRSPLMHPGFYNDIDHVRPYPPKTIIQYIENMQQQKKSAYKMRMVTNWTRRGAVEINLNMGGVWQVNLFLKLLWLWIRWPKGKPNGYVAIFQKI